MRRLTLSILGGAMALALALPAAAQMTQVHVRGQVTSIDGNTLVVTAKGAAPVTVKLADAWRVTVTKPADLNAIQPGSFIGTTEAPNADGTGKSLEVHVFPPGVKLGEGHYSWDLQPNSMMTNGTVGTVVASGDGRAIDVSYPGGMRHIVVPANVPIVGFGFGDKTMVKPGVSVFIIAAKGPDGTLTTNGVTVGQDGAPPPM